jgi:hypothetical protein
MNTGMPHSWTSSHELKFQNEIDVRKKTYSSKLQNRIGKSAGLQSHGRRELRSKTPTPETSAGAGIRIIDQNLPSFHRYKEKKHKLEQKRTVNILPSGHD